MKKFIYTVPILMLTCLTLKAQPGIEEVLKSIALHNQTLQAGDQLNKARQLEARTGNYLPNPTVELNQLWLGGNGGGSANELAVIQSFDFPTVYAHKNKLARLKVDNADLQYAITRQQILLTAQQTCQEIIYLRLQKKLLDDRLKNAERLAELYQRRLASGDANQLEFNKIQLEKINARNASRLNTAALQSKMKLLQTLNGGIPIEFKEEQFPAITALPDYHQIESQYLNSDPNLKNLENETETAAREIKLNRSLSLPKFDLGYRRNGGSDEKMNGFRIGMSIPLWENKNTVKKAKAQSEYARTNLADNIQQQKNTIRELYTQAQALQNSCREYEQALSTQRNEELLNKALEAGQISMLDYFVEITIFYDSMQNYLDVKKEYHNTLAQLFQYKL